MLQSERVTINVLAEVSELSVQVIYPKRDKKLNEFRIFLADNNNYFPSLPTILLLKLFFPTVCGSKVIMNL